MSRDWVPIDEDRRWLDEEYYDKVKPRADILAKMWSRLTKEIEEEGWRRQSNFENGFQDYDMEPGEEEFFAEQEKLAREIKDAELDIIEAHLTALGCRMMRPYEHWNEMEKYMEYMERDRY